MPVVAAVMSRIGWRSSGRAGSTAKRAASRGKNASRTTGFRIRWMRSAVQRHSSPDGRPPRLLAEVAPCELPVAPMQFRIRRQQIGGERLPYHLMNGQTVLRRHNEWKLRRAWRRARPGRRPARGPAAGRG